MNRNLKLSEIETLENYRIALENVQSQKVIAELMDELGYDSTLIKEGQKLLSQTREAFENNKTEDDETSESYAKFSQLLEKLEDTYRLHRKKAKVIFRKDTITAEQLGLTGALPRSYAKWLDTVKRFYQIAVSDNEIQNKLKRLRITKNDLNKTLSLIENLESARADYLREKGESQDATKEKDKAFYQLDDWMSEFFAVARIALDDNPQLMEVLGKQIKS